MLHVNTVEMMIDSEKRDRIERSITNGGRLDVDRAIIEISHIHDDKGLNEFMEVLSSLDRDGYLSSDDDDFYLFLPYTDEVSFEYFKGHDYSVTDLIQGLALVPRTYLAQGFINQYYRIVRFQVNGKTAFSLGKVTKNRLVQDLRAYQEYRDYQAKYQRGIYTRTYDEAHPSGHDKAPKGIAELLGDYSHEHHNQVRDKIWSILQTAHPRIDDVQSIERPAEIQDILKEAYPTVFQADNLKKYRYDYPEFQS